MALTFSPETTAKIVSFFRFINNPKTMIASAFLQLASAVLLYQIGFEISACVAVVLGFVDSGRFAILQRRRRSRW